MSSTPCCVCGGYCLRQARFNLRSDVLDLVLAESVAQVHAEALPLWWVDAAAWEA